MGRGDEGFMAHASTNSPETALGLLLTAPTKLQNFILGFLSPR